MRVLGQEVIQAEELSEDVHSLLKLLKIDCN